MILKNIKNLLGCDKLVYIKNEKTRQKHCLFYNF